mgnify:CR=1 FL=1
MFQAAAHKPESRVVCIQRRRVDSRCRRLVEDDRVEARQSMLDAYPSLKKMYAADDGNTEVFYFKNGVATISSFTHEPKVIKF